MNVPANLKYTTDHEWIEIVEGETSEGFPVAKVGITDFAQSELGDIVYVEIDTLEEVVEEGDVFGSVEAVKTTSDLLMPVTGKVIAFNALLDGDEGDNPAAINEEPYGEGWIIKIEVHDSTQIDKLLDAEAYQAEINNSN